MRYQYGTLTRRSRSKGPDIWQWRWCENGFRKATVIGTVLQYPTKSDAERAAERLRIKVNAPASHRHFNSITLGTLIDRFMEEYAPKRCRRHTLRNYRGIFNNHIRPKWADVCVKEVRALSVENWLETYPHSRPVKSHVRNLLHTLFQSAIRWEMVDRNPIELVRQSSKRLKTPRSLTPAEFKALLGELSEPYKTMTVLAACLGLRVSELVGMQWGDLDFENLTLRVQRSFVRGVIYPTKTEASAGSLPLDEGLAELLQAHKAGSVYLSDSDFVFAGDSGRPRWPESMLTDHIKPAAVRAGIGKFGWHTFRHTYSTLLHALGAVMAVQKELLRHANIQTTMNVYTQAVTSDKRNAASKVADVLWRM